MVSIQQSPGANWCGGSIIDYEWILTAAHCICEGRSTTLMDLSGWTVLAGSPFIDKAEEGSQRIAIETGYRHPDLVVGNWQNDIALLKLKEAFKYDSHVHPIMLWRARMPDWIQVNVIGWGNQMETPKEELVYPSRLMGFIGQMRPVDKCDTKLKPRTRCFDGGKKNSGACYGDSGSPISTYAPARNKQSYYVQVSLVSHGNRENCVKDAEAMTVGPEIALYCDWIKAVTGKEICLE
ncbi:unnamed protein product, partial [Mesorhabditis spiculigera]